MAKLQVREAIDYAGTYIATVSHEKGDSGYYSLEYTEHALKAKTSQEAIEETALLIEEKYSPQRGDIRKNQEWQDPAISVCIQKVEYRIYMNTEVFYREEYEEQEERRKAARALKEAKRKETQAAKAERLAEEREARALKKGS